MTIVSHNQDYGHFHHPCCQGHDRALRIQGRMSSGFEFVSLFFLFSFVMQACNDAYNDEKYHNNSDVEGEAGD